MLLDYLFPKKSLRGHEGAYITEAEMEQLVSHPQMFRKEDLKKRDMGSLDFVRVASTYSDCPLLRKAIWTFKYRRTPGLAECLAELLVSLIPTAYLPRSTRISRSTRSSRNVSSVSSASSDSSVSCVLCPVPLYFLRRFNRGFNQAERLAFLLSQKTGIQMRELLIRTRWTGRQTGRNRDERLQALKGAFKVARSNLFIPRRGLGRPAGGEASPHPHEVRPLEARFDLKGTRILLIDDIMTTGATLQECARTLREAGARNVEGVVIAHG